MSAGTTASLLAAISLLVAQGAHGQQPALVTQASSGHAARPTFGGEGRWLVLADYQASVTRIVDPASGRTIRTFPGASEVTAHPTKDLLILRLGERNVVVNPTTGDEVSTLPGAGTMRMSAVGTTVVGTTMAMKRALGMPIGGIRWLWSQWRVSDGAVLAEAFAEQTMDFGLGMGGILSLTSADGVWIHSYRETRARDGFTCVEGKCWSTRLIAAGSAQTRVEVPGAVFASHAGAQRVVVARSASGQELIPVDVPMALLDVSSGKDARVVRRNHRRILRRRRQGRGQRPVDRMDRDRCAIGIRPRDSAEQSAVRRVLDVDARRNPHDRHAAGSPPCGLAGDASPR
jgi:hypothetical protein